MGLKQFERFQLNRENMVDEFVIGFIEGEPDGLTPIDVVMDVTGLTYDEVKSCCEVVTIPEPELPEYDF